jgi:segregation and condensation protein B
MLSKQLPDGIDVHAALLALQAAYALRGVNLVRIGRKWMFRTAADLSWLLTKETVETRKLSRAAIETLAIISYHQPVTRAEIEEIRGVQTAAGTLDVLLKTGWIRPRGRRKAPGRPITYGTTEAFLTNFGLEEIGDLPGLDELKGSGLIEGGLPVGFAVPVPSDDTTLRDDEDPLDPGDLDLGLAPAPEHEPVVEPEAATEPERDTESAQASGDEGAEAFVAEVSETVVVEMLEAEPTSHDEPVSGAETGETGGIESDPAEDRAPDDSGDA